jgi:hypothetical protein
VGNDSHLWQLPFIWRCSGAGTGHVRLLVTSQKACCQ